MQGYTYMLLSTIAIINVILETGSALYCIQTAKSGTGAISGCYASAYVSPINASSVFI